MPKFFAKRLTEILWVPVAYLDRYIYNGQVCIAQQRQRFVQALIVYVLNRRHVEILFKAQDQLFAAELDGSR